MVSPAPRWCVVNIVIFTLMFNFTGFLCTACLKTALTFFRCILSLSMVSVIRLISGPFWVPYREKGPSVASTFGAGRDMARRKPA